MELHPRQQKFISCLLALPTDVLHLIWNKLCQQEHQLALRCVCRAARQSTTALINALAIQIDDLGSLGDDASAALVQEGLTQLARFPCAATLTNLSWRLEGALDDDMPHGLLFPSFHFRAGGRLAAVKSMRLDCGVHMALTSGDVGSIVDACPRLESLDVSMAVLGPAFYPLSRLQGLRQLKLDISAPRGAADVAASLSNLCTLTELVLKDCIVYATDPASLALEDFLPHIKSLDALRRLDINVNIASEDNNDDKALDHTALQHFTSLSQLTYLSLGTGAFSKYGSEIGSFAHPASQIVHLQLLHAILETDAVRLVAAMPHLTHLAVYQLCPQEDLSGLTTSWRKLSVEFSNDPRDLVWSPLDTVAELDVSVSDTLCWVLDDSYDLDIAATVHKAALVLARADWHKVLMLDSQSDLPSSSQLLAALAPLNEVKELKLRLSGHWQLTHRHARALADHLPNLQRLTLWEDPRDDLVDFIPALGRMAQLTNLSLYTSYDAAGVREAAPGAHDALLALAVVRANNGLPLHIHVASMLPEHVARCNALVKASSRGLSEGQVVVFVHW